MELNQKKLTIDTSHLKTLHDWQQLLGDVQWIRPSLAIKTGDLRPLYDMLLGDPDPTSPRILTPAARQALRLLLDNIERVHLQQINYDQSLNFVVLASNFAPTGVFWQDGPILWVHMPASPARVVTPYYEAILQLLWKAKKVAAQTFGKYPDKIITPYTKDQLVQLQQYHDEWTLFLTSFSGSFDSHYPQHPLMVLFKNHPIIFPRVIRGSPIPSAHAVFTDASPKGNAVVVSGGKVWKSPVGDVSAQAAEVTACLIALQLFPGEPVNLYTDSVYMAHIFKPLETSAYISPTSNVHHLLSCVQHLIWQRTEPLFVGHIRSHTRLPGPLSASNDLADKYTHVCFTSDCAQNIHFTLMRAPFGIILDACEK